VREPKGSGFQAERFSKGTEVTGRNPPPRSNPRSSSPARSAGEKGVVVSDSGQRTNVI
jgi:hypothetical protein